MPETKTPPILSHKHYEASSAFKPENLLREARRQKGLAPIDVPEICILDPDGDMVRHLRSVGSAHTPRRVALLSHRAIRVSSCGMRVRHCRLCGRRGVCGLDC